MLQDRNFDDLSHKFKRKIYDSPKGQIRLAIVWEDLLEMIPALLGPPLRILDVGAGLGQMALNLAKLGHEVVLCDHSIEMLRLAEELFTVEAPLANVRFVHAPVQQLHNLIEGDFDVVLLHAVLEWLAEPQATLAGMMRFCRPQGYFSLLFYNIHALTYLNLVKGNLRKVAAENYRGDPKSLTPTHPQDPFEVYGWLQGLGLTLLRKSGVRVFYDLMPASVRTERPMEDVLALERSLARREPYCSLGRYIHVVCQR